MKNMSNNRNSRKKFVCNFELGSSYENRNTKLNISLELVAMHSYSYIFESNENFTLFQIFHQDYYLDSPYFAIW